MLYIETINPSNDTTPKLQTSRIPLQHQTEVQFTEPFFLFHLIFTQARVVSYLYLFSTHFSQREPQMAKTTKKQVFNLLSASLCVEWRIFSSLSYMSEAQFISLFFAIPYF